MSRAYRVTVRGSVHRVVHVEDGICTELELLPVLAPERTAELLDAELAARGFTTKDGVASRASDDGVVIEIVLKTGAVSVKAEASADIAIEKEQSAMVAEEVIEDGRRRAQALVAASAEADAQTAERKAREEVTARLEKKLGDLRKELDGVTARVTSSALKEKARSLGEIEEMSEDPETGELTIKVRL